MDETETIDWHEWFVYDETSPSCLRWKVDRVSGRYQNHVHVKAGDVCGAVNSSGYWQVKLHETLYSCHRVIIEMFGEVIGDNIVDHRDGDKLNNKRVNLRVVKRKFNPQNCKMRSDNKSGVTGVSLIRNKGNLYWQARVEGFEKPIRKSFSVSLYGDDEAFRLACESRQQMIQLLNAQGAKYTERHGKEPQ